MYHTYHRALMKEDKLKKEFKRQNYAILESLYVIRKRFLLKL